MRSLTEKIWYGTAQESEGATMAWRRPLLLALVVVLLVALRLALPGGSGDTARVYQEMAWALAHEQNWGKQALVGVLEYPPLPTVVLLVLTGLPAWLHLAPLAFMVAACQVWTATYVVRTVRLYTRHPAGLLVAAAGIALPFLGADPWGYDPAWLYLVPLASILFHLCRWEQQQSLRDAVVVALNAGLLVFGGLPGMVLGAGALLTLWARGDRRLVRGPGGWVLLSMPWLYAALLYPLFNWLIMGHPWFFLSRLLDWLHGRGLGAHLAAGGCRLPLLVIAALVLALSGLAIRAVPVPVACGWVWLAGAGVVALLRTAGGWFLSGEYQLTGYLALPALFFLLLPFSQWGKRGAWLPWILAGNALVLLAAFTWRHDARRYETFATDIPPAAEVLAYVDQHWDQSRILIYDLRTAVVYAPLTTQRFWARLDYHEGLLRQQAKGEQFHLLIPPNDGRFYGPQARAAQLHTEGAPFLFFERTWPAEQPAAWQLWRCIRATPPPPATTGAKAAVVPRS